MRRLLALLLATFAFGSASAAQVVYEFRAVVGTHTKGFGGGYFDAMTPGAHVVGTLTLDPARSVNGAIAPVVALKLVTLDTGEVIHDSEGETVTSQIETVSAAGVESVLISARFVGASEQDPSTRMRLSWASPGQGQLPADPRTLNILALKPYGWRIDVDGFEGFPCEAAHCRDSDTNSQIYSFKRAAAPAEYEQRFASTTSNWIDSSGDWTPQSGYYTNAANVAFTSSVYTGQTLQPFVEVSADLYSGFTGAGNALGLVVNYKNAANFYEVRFTANGVVTINKVVNGVRTMLQTGSYAVPPKTFFHVSVLRDFEAIEVRVNNGQPITAEDSALKDGEAGVFASWNRARFDNFVVDQLSTWGVGFQTDFGFMAPPNPFTPRSGTWLVQEGFYWNRTNQSAAISTAGFPPAAGDFTFYASLRGQWSGAGNRGGLVWDYRDERNYSAMLLSPGVVGRAGTLEVIEVVAGVRRVLANSSGQLPVGFWGRASISRIDGVLRITAPFMTELLIVAQQARGGDVGLIASWNFVRFDDVVFSAQNGPN